MAFSFRSSILLLVLIILAVVAGGCGAIVNTNDPNVIYGSGKLVSTDYDFAGFDTINAGSNFALSIHQGDKFAVKVTADDNLVPLITVEMTGGELKLGFKDTSSTLRRVTMKGEITMPALKSLTLVSNASAELDSYQSPSLALHVNSNNGVTGSVQAEKLIVDAASNGDARLTGTADTLTVFGQGNAVLTLDGVTANDARVDIGSNAKVSVKATGKLDYSVGGNAGLTYSGGAKLGEQKTAGNGWARGR